MRIKWRWWGWGIGVAMVISIVILALRPRPVSVEIAPVERGGLQSTISAEGRTRLHDRFIVAAPVTGRLSRIELHRGDQVREGSVIGWIEPPPLNPLDPRQQGVATARVAAAAAAIRETMALADRERTNLEQLRRERLRVERLVESGDLPRQDLERISSSVASAEQQLAAALSRVSGAKAEVEAAQAALLSLPRPDKGGPSSQPDERVPVRSPVSGRVLRLFEESERVVTAGTPLIEISNPATLELVIEVLSSDAVRLRPGTAVIVDRWGGDRTLRAAVRLIEPAAFTRVSALGIEEQRVNIIADLLASPGSPGATDPDAARLGDGYRIEAQLIVEEVAAAVKAPLSALFRLNEGWAVYVAADGRAEVRPITIGIRSDAAAEVLAGLSPGTMVILHPPSDLKPGARITGKLAAPTKY